MYMTNIQIENKKLQQVNKFKYLGEIKNSKGGHEAETYNRINNTTKLYHAMSTAFVNKKC